MPSERTDGVLRDILHHIDLATQFVKGFDLEAFKPDIRTVYAVTRCLEIISEASRRLPADLKARHPQIAWRQMAAAGNVYRHDYEDVLAQLVWDTVQRALPSLRAVIREEIARQILGRPGTFPAKSALIDIENGYPAFRYGCAFAMAARSLQLFPRSF